MKCLKGSCLAVFIALLLFTTGCLSPAATPLKLDTYEGVEGIQFEGKQFRTDIGARVLTLKGVHN